MQKTQQIVPQSYRFVNLILFSLISLTNNIPCQSLTGIAPAISEIYQVSALQVNSNSLFFSISYVLFIFPSNYIIDKKGLKISTFMCQTLMCIGLFIRCFINTSFYLFLLGSFICSLGYNIILSAANKFPNVWFLDKQILPIKSIVLCMLFTSDALGIFLSSAFISKQSTKQEVQRFFIVQSGVIILFNVLNMIFFKGIPKIPQNFASQASKVKENYFTDLKKLISNKNYLKLFGSMTFINSAITLIFASLAWLGQAYNFSTQQCGYIFVIGNITGLIGCSLNGFILKDKYKFKSKVLLIVGSISFAFIWIGFETHQLWIIYLASITNGLSVFPFVVNLLDFSAQTAFPIGEATSGGSLVFGGSTFGFLMIILFSLYINDNVTVYKCRITLSVLVAFLAISYLFLNVSEEDYKRNQYEERMKNQNKVSLISQNSSFVQN